jgi:phenylalanine dehydrogenase
MASINRISTVEAANKMCEQRIVNNAKRNGFFTTSLKPKWAFGK